MGKYFGFIEAKKKVTDSDGVEWLLIGLEGYGEMQAFFGMRDRWIRLYKKDEKSDAPNYESTIPFLKYLQLQATQKYMESCAKVDNYKDIKKMSFKENIRNKILICTMQKKPRRSKQRLIQLQ